MPDPLGLVLERKVAAALKNLRRITGFSHSSFDLLNKGPLVNQKIDLSGVWLNSYLMRLIEV